MISATEAKKLTENSFEKIFNYLNEVIRYAANDNRYYCLIGINENNSRQFIRKIESLGYNLEYLEKGDIKIEWGLPREVDNQPRWIKRKRYDGEPFYECSGCGKIAAEKRFCYCPNCKCEMENGEEVLNLS